MYRSLAICAALCGGIWLHLAAPTAAQNTNPYVASPAPYVSPTVSPYLNLGVTTTGLSNYQTLVRPLIDDREALLRQANTLQKLQQQQQQQLREPTGGQAVNDPVRRDGTSRTGTGRFLYYSHYFGAPR